MLERFLANWPLKLLALVLAFAIWVSVTGESRILQDFQVPLEIRLGEELVLASQPPTAVSVRLRGLESVMRRVDPVPMVLRVDLDQPAPGEHDVLLSREALFGVPRGVEVVFVNPDRVIVTVDRRLRQQLPVEPAFLGQPAQGYSLYGSRVVPPTMLVEGPESEVRGLELLRTNPIRLDRRTASFTASVGAAPEGSLVRLVDPRALEVQVFIDRTAVERRIQGLPVRVVGAGAAASASPEALDVTLTGPPGVLERLTKERVRLIADAAGLGPGREAEVRVDFIDLSAEERAKIRVKSISRQRVAVHPSGGGTSS